MVDQYSDEEAQKRFEAALRGARVAAKKEMKDIPPKRKPKAKSKKKKGAG